MATLKTAKGTRLTKKVAEELADEAERGYDLSKADVILSLDADFLSCGPGHLRYTRDFSDRRDVAELMRLGDDKRHLVDVQVNFLFVHGVRIRRDRLVVFVGSLPNETQSFPALSTIIRALHDALPNRSDMFAYLAMMAPRPSPRSGMPLKA